MTLTQKASIYCLFEALAAEHEVAAQIFLAHNWVLGKLLARALEQNLAFEEQVGTVGNAQCLGGVVVGDQDSYVLVFEAVDYALDVFHSDGVYSSKGFVEHDESWVDG